MGQTRQRYTLNIRAWPRHFEPLKFWAMSIWCKKILYSTGTIWNHWMAQITKSICYYYHFLKQWRIQGEGCGGNHSLNLRNSFKYYINFTYFYLFLISYLFFIFEFIIMLFLWVSFLTKYFESFLSQMHSWFVIH